MTSPLARIGLSSLMGLGMALGSLTAHAAAGTSLVVDGNVANACPDGGTAITRGCRYGGEKTFDKITVQNGGVIEVASFLTDKTTTGNLVLKSLSSIDVDVTSRITAKGAGYQGELCNNGPGPVGFPFAGGRGGCSVQDSGGGGAHFGRGGKGTKDCFLYPGPNGTVDVTCSFPNEWEEACGTKVVAMNGTISCSNTATQPGGLACYGTSTPLTGGGDALPDVSGQSFYHNIFDIEFGAAGGDKGCRDNNGFGAGDPRG